MKQMLLIAALAAIFTSCTTVKPYERGGLSKPEMAWSTDSLKSTLDGHIYFSKEAASGGTAAAGGGCGCN